MNVGRQSAQKGQTLLVESFAEVARRVVDAHLVIVGGEGSSSAEIIARVRTLGLEGRVTMVGYTPVVHQYLAHAGVFVFSSVMEGLGTAVLEAMSFAIPVVAFDIPPVREATSDGRFARLVAVGDTQAMAQGIISVLESDVDRDLEAREWILRYRGVDVVAAAVEKLVISTAQRTD
jgi:glycosyltransferase involved in cell wall biosynthesis